MQKDMGRHGTPLSRAFAASRHAVGSLAHVRPNPHPRWPLGLQAATALAVPIVVGAATGHAAFGFQAATSAFALLYFGGARPIDRARLVPLIGLVLFACAAAGAVAGASALATGVGLVAVGVLAGFGSQAFSIGPPGPLFLVLVYGSAAHITRATDGVRAVEPLGFLLAFAAGLAFTWLVAAAPLVRARHRADPTPLRVVAPGPALSVGGAAVALRVCTVALVGAMLGALAVDPDRAYWVVCAGVAVVGVQAPRRSVVSRGLHRVVGTVVGVLVFAGLAQVPWSTVGLAVVLGALQMTTELIVIRHYALALVLITPLVLLLVSHAGGAPGSVLAQERIVDTAVGAALGVCAVLLPSPLRGRAGGDAS
ncbi:FUSC family protein [Demequina capsici]|uniref:FUSC family protein n=1 Tax=Demequina capsici TaxID=3075620 RepID=A0AA96F7N2_9MICO|nr:MULTISPECIES: FUSC family protein [unclassified Demequina]WNM24250.1 FUSC family protein [Demequina sp. OYTSA14]WNM27079.1 FUSC family protein [Demequina sp. PMTSA13]